MLWELLKLISVAQGGEQSKPSHLLEHSKGVRKPRCRYWNCNQENKPSWPTESPFTPRSDAESCEESTDLEPVVCLKGSARRQCPHGAALEREGTQLHVEDGVSSAVSSSWALSASQAASAWENTSDSLASLAYSTGIPMLCCWWALPDETVCTKPAYIYFIIILSSYLLCSKCILDILCSCLQVLKALHSLQVVYLRFSIVAWHRETPPSQHPRTRSGRIQTTKVMHEIWPSCGSFQKKQIPQLLQPPEKFTSGLQSPCQRGWKLRT